MTDKSESFNRAALLEIYLQEAADRLRCVLDELAKGAGQCDFERLYQEFDSLQTGARAVDIHWLEEGGRVLAAYCRFLLQLPPGRVSTTFYTELAQLVRALLVDCTSFTSDQPDERIAGLLTSIEQRMHQALGTADNLGRALAEGRQPVILLVDDSATSRLLFRLHLPQAERFRLLEAADSATALQLARQECPDVAVLDYNMPDHNGVEIAHLLREVVPTRSPAFVLLSANLQRSVLESAAEAGFVALLEKPINEEKMSRMLAELGA